jgi:hypothetical protein
MDATAHLQSQKFLYLRAISEPSDNTLRLIIDAAEVSTALGETKACGAFSSTREISAGLNCSSYEVTFATYIAYCVRNESYAALQKDEVWKGNLFREFSSSRFLTYLREATFARDDYPGPYLHYSFVCLNHIVDVASVLPPAVRLLDK